MNWILLITVIFLNSGQVTTDQYRSRGTFTSQAECVQAGYRAMDSMRRAGVAVNGMGFACAPQSTEAPRRQGEYDVDLR